MNTLGDTDEDFDISKLNPEDVRDEPNWTRSPWTLAMCHAWLLFYGARRISWVWAAESLEWTNLPWEMWVWGLCGLGVGLGLVLRDIRPIRQHELLLDCVLKGHRPLRTDMIGLLVAIGVVIGISFLLSGPHRALALGAWATAFVVATLPAYVYRARRWKLAWEIICRVKAKPEGEE